MRMKLAGCFVLSTLLLALAMSAQEQRTGAVVIPRTWDDAEIATQIPLADATASPKHVTTDYYYRIPVRPIYKSYPVYAPGREPAGYLEWLKQQEPVVLWDDHGHAPPLRTEADWIRAGEIVFDASPGPNRFFRIEDVRNPTWYEKTGARASKDGVLPALQYVVKTKGIVELGVLGCASCHTRVMPDGSVLKGAQSNEPIQREAAFGMRAGVAASHDGAQYLAQLRGLFKSIHGAPWLRPDPEARIDTMSVAEIADVLDAVPPGTSLRQGTNTFLPMQVPDLIGVKDRRYLDHTGLGRHRDIGDFMRYAAMNQGADLLASYAGFVPADVPRLTQQPAPETRVRYSDEQLYALTLYVYSLRPPPNPNPFDALAEHGQTVFRRENCGTCHTPPLYTSNKLTPAAGFEIPPEHLKTYDILRNSVGTDPALALRTRRGTGYYKVPSLKGLWYRTMFPHDGSCATLEDWFDAARLRDDYVPTGFKGYGIERRAVPGHEFGLRLSVEDKRALIAFLKTL
jgi:mono/diheme cytochrome c family protein